MPDTLGAVSRNLTAYRVMAAIVGVLLVVLCLVGVPLAYGLWQTLVKAAQLLG